MLAGVLAGSIAGFFTNSIEYLAVNKQADPSFRTKEFLKQKGAIRQLLF
jgi:hypothetical protein